MTPHMLDFVRDMAWYGGMEGPVLEVGSYIEANQEHMDLRRAFPKGTTYVGVDIIPGTGVDRSANLMDEGQMVALVEDLRPKTVLCLYVLEHVWDIKKAMNTLGAMWRCNNESWLWVSTHQNQPFHGTSQYPDYWRVTAPAMRRLAEEAGIEGAHGFVSPDTSNPWDVLMIRQPASMGLSDELVNKAMRVASAKWGQYY